MIENQDVMILNKMAEIGTKVENVGTQINSVEEKCTETNTKVNQFASGAVNSSPVQYKISTLKNNLSYVDCTDTYFNNFENKSGSVTFFVFNDSICRATYYTYSVYLQGSLNPNNPDEYIRAEASPKCGDQYHSAITVVHKNKIHAIGSYHYIYDYNSGWTQSTMPSGINTSSSTENYYISTEYFLHCFNVTYSGSTYTVRHSTFNGESWSATETIIDGANSFELSTNPVNSLIYFIYGKRSGGVDIKHYCKMSNSNFTEINIDDVPKCLYNETYGVASSFVPIDDNNYAVFFANKGVYLLNATGALNFAFKISDMYDIYKANDQYYVIAKPSNNYRLYRIINFCTSYCSDTLRCLKGNKILCSSKVKPLTSNVKRINDNMIEVTETGDVQLWLQKTGEDDHDFDFAIS